MLEPQNGVDAISIALLILHRITLTNTGKIKDTRKVPGFGLSLKDTLTTFQR